jgi:hypothetical protein
MSFSGSGGVSFSSTILVVNADDTVSIRQMNFDGSFYDAAMDLYEDDNSAESLDLGTSAAEGDDADDGMAFLDAVQHQIRDNEDDDPGNDDDYFQSFRCDRLLV